MRIHFQISKNKEPVPFDHLPNLVGAFHKWMGQNEFHNQTSFYSLSWLKGAERKNNYLSFPKGATWFISFYDDTIAKKCLKGILKYPEIAFGMEIKEVLIQETPVFSTVEKFNVASPILIKENLQEGQKFYFYNDEKSNDLLTKTLKFKLEKAGLNQENVEIQFDTSYHKPDIKLATYKSIKNKASICPVIVKGSIEQVAFAWNVGIGNSTGIGFGSLI